MPPGALPPADGNLLERETGFEPATSTLARLHSTTELLPRTVDFLCVTEEKVKPYSHFSINFQFQLIPRPIMYFAGIQPEPVPGRAKIAFPSPQAALHTGRYIQLPVCESRPATAATKAFHHSFHHGQQSMANYLGAKGWVRWSGENPLGQGWLRRKPHADNRHIGQFCHKPGFGCGIYGLLQIPGGIVAFLPAFRKNCALKHEAGVYAQACGASFDGYAHIPQEFVGSAPRQPWHEMNTSGHAGMTDAAYGHETAFCVVPPAACRQNAIIKGLYAQLDDLAAGCAQLGQPVAGKGIRSCGAAETANEALFLKVPGRVKAYLPESGRKGRECAAVKGKLRGLLALSCASPQLLGAVMEQCLQCFG